jgi:hypothetical protein
VEAVDGLTLVVRPVVTPAQQSEISDKIIGQPNQGAS